jgi:hypothetical protein
VRICNVGRRLTEGVREYAGQKTESGKGVKGGGSGVIQLHVVVIQLHAVVIRLHVVRTRLMPL